MSEFYCMQCGAIEDTCEHWTSSDPSVPPALLLDGGEYCEICGMKNNEPGCEFNNHPNENNKTSCSQTKAGET